jgi:hypothetical protein
MIAQFGRERKQKGKQGTVETLLKRSFCGKRQKPPDMGVSFHFDRHIYGIVAKKVVGMVIHFSYSTTCPPGVLFPILIAWPSSLEIVSASPDLLKPLSDWLDSNSWPFAFIRLFFNSILSMFLILNSTPYLSPVSSLVCSFQAVDECTTKSGGKIPDKIALFVPSQRRGNGGIIESQHTGPPAGEEARAMYREDRLVIRLSNAERAAIEQLAQVERLPASTLARRMLLREVDRRGLWPPPGGELETDSRRFSR